MLRRNEMEVALKTKIDELLTSLEKRKQLEEKLKEEAISNIERFHEEDMKCDQLENKLKSLELTLLQSERENDLLKAKLHDAEVRLEREEEFHNHEEDHINALNMYKVKLTTQLQEVEAENEEFSTAADAASTKTVGSITTGRRAEASSHQETQRLFYLEHQLQDVEEKLAAAQARHESVKENNSEGEQKLSEMESKRTASEGRAEELDMEVGRLEDKVEELMVTLEGLKIAQGRREVELEERRRAMKEEVEAEEGQLKKNTIHQAQSVSRKKK